MKLDIHNPVHAELISRYLNREMDDKEIDEFEGLIEVEEDNIKLIKSLEKQWAMIGKRPASSPDALHAWKKVHSRLEHEGLIPDASQFRKKASNRNLLLAAAVLLILVGVSAVIYWSMFRDKRQANWLSLNTTSENYTQVLTLPDGSIVYVAGNSSLSYPEVFSSDERVVDFKGEAYFDIAPDPEKPFVIRTGDGIIEVLGTSFTVRSGQQGDFELLVDKGMVKVVLEDQPSKQALVGPGEAVSAIAGELKKSFPGNEGNNNWYLKRIHFKDEKLFTILNVLNRNFNTTFVVAAPEIGQRKLTVTFDKESVETLTEILCISLNLKSQISNDSIILSDQSAATRENLRTN